jgi:protein-tyrosine-phosphatase
MSGTPKGPKFVTCVCTANVCRSPMAEALLRHALAAEPEPLKSLQVVSAGVSAWDGYPITENSAAALCARSASTPPPIAASPSPAPCSKPPSSSSA